MSSRLYCRLNVMELIGNNHLSRSPEGIKLIPIPSNPPCGQPVHKIPRKEQNNEPDNTDDFRILIQRHMVEIRLFFRKVSAFPCNIWYFDKICGIAEWLGVGCIVARKHVALWMDCGQLVEENQMAFKMRDPARKLGRNSLVGSVVHVPGGKGSMGPFPVCVFVVHHVQKWEKYKHDYPCRQH